MKKLDERQAKALARLRYQDDFLEFQRWLTESIADTDTKLHVAEGARIGRLQGEALCLTSVQDTIARSRDIAEKLKKS